ncbi:glycosyltransferase family 4 protein [Methylosinus sp. C49]|uniref:glycosyltransferase family 4 protein n=1 Tax=Methylosinus sp. C49 TaxID=2699395 RepID=UPI00137B2018|nr:glycosyltransferase family 4 protein [Methylosinus sp. C49]
MTNIVFIGQLPPPVNGLTFITRQLAQRIEAGGHRLVVKNTTSSVKTRGFIFHASRAIKTFAAILCLLLQARRADHCYSTAEGGLGLMYTLALVVSARLLRYRIYLHHHSYSYINKWRPLMAGVMRAAGPDAVHLCLSLRMCEQLAATYQTRLKAVVVSNAGFISVNSDCSHAPRHDAIRIGLLSNLNAQKGLYIFLEILRAAKLRNLPIVGVLAGPITQSADNLLLESLREELSGVLDYRGAIYGESKEAFFRDVDVFVFPSYYVNEAQPTVVYEALANGTPVIASHRGCISDQIGAAGYILTSQDSFVTEALAIIVSLHESRESLDRMRALALKQFEKERDASNVVIANLFDALPEHVMPRKQGAVSA